MTHPNGSVSGGVPLDRLVTAAMEQLVQSGYSRRSLHRYRTVWEHLIEFADQWIHEDLSFEDLAARFMEAYWVGDVHLETAGARWRKHIESCLSVLGHFARHGCIERPRANLKNSCVLPVMESALREYEQYCTDKLFLQPSTLQRRSRELGFFLDFLRQRNVESVHQIKTEDLSEFVSCRNHLKASTVSRIITDIRSFLRFLVMRGLTHKDLSLELPKVRVHRDVQIPSVWEPELIEKLLHTIDRSSAKGKRDYAILILASRLGMRAGDIRMLQLDDIKWEESRIEIRQSKTKIPLSLPLTEEVGQALIDYLRSGRPKTSHRQIFLKLLPPFEPFTGNNLYHIVTYWRCLAGIAFQSPHRRGLHSLRHSLATRLLHDGTPIQTISGILGHLDLESTRIYAKADVESLRIVALDTEEVRHE
jgi:site-specific recombinase XerD